MMKNYLLDLSMIVMCTVPLFASCVQSDLYELYDDEDLCINRNTPKTKGWLDNWWQDNFNSTVKDNWLDNECGLWALMVLNNNTEDSKSNRLYHMRKIAHFVNYSVDLNNSSEHDVCITYYWQIRQGGINNIMLRGALHSLGVNFKHYKTEFNSDMEAFWTEMGISPNGNMSSVNKVVIVQQKGSPGHYGKLESIENGVYTLSTHGGETNTCTYEQIGSFFIKK